MNRFLLLCILSLNASLFAMESEPNEAPNEFKEFTGIINNSNRTIDNAALTDFLTDLNTRSPEEIQEISFITQNKDQRPLFSSIKELIKGIMSEDLILKAIPASIYFNAGGENISKESTESKNNFISLEFPKKIYFGLPLKSKIYLIKHIFNYFIIDKKSLNDFLSVFSGNNLERISIDQLLSLNIPLIKNLNLSYNESYSSINNLFNKEFINRLIEIINTMKEQKIINLIPIRYLFSLDWFKKLIANGPQNKSEEILLRSFSYSQIIDILTTFSYKFPKIRLKNSLKSLEINISPKTLLNLLLNLKGEFKKELVNQDFFNKIYTGIHPLDLSREILSFLSEKVAKLDKPEGGRIKLNRINEGEGLLYKNLFSFIKYYFISGSYYDQKIFNEFMLFYTEFFDIAEVFTYIYGIESNKRLFNDILKYFTRIRFSLRIKEEMTFNKKSFFYPLNDLYSNHLKDNLSLSRTEEERKEEEKRKKKKEAEESAWQDKIDLLSPEEKVNLFNFFFCCFPDILKFLPSYFYYSFMKVFSEKGGCYFDSKARYEKCVKLILSSYQIIRQIKTLNVANFVDFLKNSKWRLENGESENYTNWALGKLIGRIKLKYPPRIMSKYAQCRDGRINKTPTKEKNGEVRNCEPESIKNFNPNFIIRFIQYFYDIFNWRKCSESELKFFREKPNSPNPLFSFLSRLQENSSFKATRNAAMKFCKLKLSTRNKACEHKLPNRISLFFRPNIIKGINPDLLIKLLDFINKFSNNQKTRERFIKSIIERIDREDCNKAIVFLEKKLEVKAGNIPLQEHTLALLKKKF